MTVLGRIRSRLDSDQGYTLPELLVTITLLAIVMSGVTATAVSVSRAVGRSNAINADLGVARTATARLAQQIRGAVSASGEIDVGDIPFDVARKDTITFYSNLGVAPGSGPDKITFTADAGTGDLREQIWTAAGAAGAYTWPGSARVDRIIARDLASAEVFGYVTFRNLSNPCGLALDPGAGSLSAADRAIVDTVDITVSVLGETSYNNNPTTLTSRTRVANSVNLGRIQDFTTWEALPTSTQYCS